MTKAQKNKVKLNGFVSVLDFGADKTGTNDSSAAFTAALAANKKVYIPSGSYRLNSTVALPTSAHLMGDGVATAISVFGVNAFSVAAGVSFVTIESIGLFSNSAGGAGDPRTFVAVQCNGTSPSNVNYVTLRDLYLQGWADAINWRYTWNSRIENVTAINSNNGVVVFGQSVNNSITGCRLSANGGNASVRIINDGPIIGEGLMISDTLMSSGTYGVLTGTGFLALHISNCIIDLISGDAIRSTDCRDLRVSNSWLYATNCCVRMQALGSLEVQGASITNNGMTVTSTTGRVIEQNVGNSGVAITGNRFTFSGTALGIYLDGQSTSVDNNHFANTGTGTSVVLNTAPTTHRVGKNTGNATVTFGFGTPEYSEANWTPTDVSGASLSLTSNGQATYVKNGKMVSVFLDITYPTTSSTEIARISLPFRADSGCQPVGNISLQSINGSFQISGSTTATEFVFWKPGASGAFATNANLSGGRFQVTLTYRANV